MAGDSSTGDVVPTPRAQSYLEYAVAAGLPRGETAPPHERAASPMVIEKVDTKILDAALRMDSDPGFAPVPTRVLDAALRMDSEPPIATASAPSVTASAPSAGASAQARAVPKLALHDAPSAAARTAPSPSAASGAARDSIPLIEPVPTRVLEHALRPLSEPEIEVQASRAESEFDYAAPSRDDDIAGDIDGHVVDDDDDEDFSAPAVRAPSGREHDDDLDFALRPETVPPATHPRPAMAMAPHARSGRAPSGDVELALDDGEADGVEGAAAPLQVAVFESAANLQAAALAVAGAGHAMVVGASGKDGLEKIGLAIVDGHIDALVVGLPGGEVLIKAALSLAPHRPLVIAACSGKPADAVREANATGADLVALRPHDPERLAPVLLAAARMLEQRRDVALALAQHGEDPLERLASIGDEGAGDADADVGGLQSFEAFQRALELELKRVRRYQYALSLALFALEIPAEQAPPPGILGILRARAGNALLHSIRDIDMATELDQDRFLVCLPYTDLTGATEVARRIIGAVAAIAPVTAAGQQYRPRLVGAIAGTRPGAQLSFTKLVRDATRALEAAQRDGAELAVQP